MKMKTLTAILLLIFFPSIQAQNSFKIVNKPYVHQQVGCDATSGVQIGDYVYLVEDNTVVVMDVSNPTDMQMIAGIDVKNRYGLKLLNEEYLLARRYSRINISNPRKPFIEETVRHAIETSTVSYELGRKGLSIQCKVGRDEQTAAYLPLSKMEVIAGKNGGLLSQINGNLLAVFHNNLHFIDVSSSEDPQIVGTYTYNIPNAPRTSVSAMQVYDQNTLCIFTDCGIDFIDFQDVGKPKLKGRYLFDIEYSWYHYENIVVNTKQQHVIYVQVEDGAEGYAVGEIKRLKHLNFQNFEEKTIFQTKNGYGIELIKPLENNQRYSFYLQLDKLIAVDNHYGKLAGELTLGNRLLDFDIGENYVFACGRNAFDSKMVVYQNNGNGDLTYLNVIRDDYRNTCITANDNLLIIGGNGIGDGFDGFHFQIYDLLNVLNPILLYNSQTTFEAKKTPLTAFNSLSLKDDFLVANAHDYSKKQGNVFNTYDLSNPIQPQLTNQIPCKAYYQFFQFDETDFWLAYRDSPKAQTVHLAYPILKNGIAEVLQLEYENFEAMTKDSNIEASVREAVKMLYDWKALPKPNSDGFLYKKLSVHKGYAYELPKNKGIRIYKIEEYGKRFEKEKR